MRFIQRIEQLIKFLMALCIAGMSILIFTNVILRYAFHTGITWAEEMSRFMFIWMVFLGAILALKEGSHIGMDLLLRKVPEKFGKALILIGNIIMFIVSIIILGGSFDMTMDSVDSKAPATGISLAIMYGVGIIMGFAMVLITASNIFRVFKPVNQEENPENKK